MFFNAKKLPYGVTNYFTPIVLDYIAGSEKLEPFYAHTPGLEGIKASIEERKAAPVDRELLFTGLNSQYLGVEQSDKVKKNIALLRDEHTFTVCTAHQPNLFTGPVYFMYKILHTIKLSESLHKELPGLNFVPVYYMGSEDADFAELNHTYVRGKKIEWQKQQTGSVGRMVVDDTLLALIEELGSQLYFEHYAGEVIQLLRNSYRKGQDIQSATFQLLNGLYGKYGLVVLMPDNAAYKRTMNSIFRDDLFNNVATGIVAKTSQRLEEGYKVQATPREINLFYLKDNIRERIIQDGASFRVHNTGLLFSREEMETELEQHPERFSPNVILRGLYQEKILPNIAFIGGGGELAYWLQLKDLFIHYKVPFPLLLLRNSFLIIGSAEIQVKEKLQLSVEQLFTPAFDLLNQLIEAGGNKPSLAGELAATRSLYEALHRKASAVDVTLVQHVEALKSKTLKQITALEKKLMRAERKKHVALDGKIKKLKEQLFPLHSLQERVENFSSFHAKWGPAFIDELLLHSPAMEQQFVVLEERDSQ